MKTYMANSNTVERAWFVVDAKGKRLGRLATEVASVLRGKHKPTFTPHMDCGDHVVILPDYALLPWRLYDASTEIILEFTC